MPVHTKRSTDILLLEAQQQMIYRFPDGHASHFKQLVKAMDQFPDDAVLRL